MKKKIIRILLIFLLAGCTNQTTTEVTDAARFKEEYESLNKNQEREYRTLEIEEANPFVYKSVKDVLEKMEKKESFVVYFGFSTCPWCRSVIPSLIKAANALEINEIYYVDVKDIRDTLTIDETGNIVTEKEGTEDYYQLLEKLGNLLEEYTLTDSDGKEISTGEKRIYAPNIVSIVNGVPTEITDGISSLQTDGNMELTEAMEEESYEKIKCSIQCVADSKKVCAAKTKC